VGETTGGKAWRAALAVVFAVVVGAILVGALLTRDGGHDVAAPPPPPTSATPATPATTTDPPRAPLTGVVVPAGADLDHPAVAIKVSDVRQAHPQAGVHRADVVFVEPIGLSYTRIAAVFHSDLPETVGPVRSVRPMDAPLLGPLRAVFGNSMGAPWVMEYVDSVADLDDLGTTRVSGSGAYDLDPQRPAPDHVFANPRVLLSLSSFTAPPDPYFGYALTGDRSSAESAGGPGQVVEIPYGPAWTVTWRFDEGSGGYLRSQPWGAHTTTDEVQVGAVNVLVLDVPSAMGKIGEGGGAPVPILELVHGSGRLIALTGGHSVTGTWSKAGVNDPFVLRTDSGEELLLAPGNTWVELPAPSAGVSTH
jgi:Protein of unknown function (DUF3048) N-terminal domain/Protein of unknown function (DUF3048) C-terminal domain